MSLGGLTEESRYWRFFMNLRGLSHAMLVTSLRSSGSTTITAGDWIRR